VACFQTAAVALVLPALEALAGRHPGVRAEVMEAEAEDSLPGLRLADHDVVVAEEYDHAPRPRDATLERAELCRDRMLVALPAGHPLAARERVPLADLAEEAWVTAREGTAFGAMLVRACRARGGFEPEIRHRTNDLRLLSEIVARGMAVGLVPSLGLAWVVPGVVIRPPAEAPLDRRIFTAVRRGTGARPAIRVLQAALGARAAELGLA
jgi:DNA-binding transcriptional LysR family regulator